MTNRRTILWLLAALALTVASHALLSYRGGAEKMLVHRTGLVDAVPEAVVRVELSRSGNPRTVLVKTGRWRLVEPYSAIVDERSVMKLLDTLSSGEIQDAIGAQELLRLGRVRADFGLESPRVSVSVFWPDGAESVSLGSATPSGEGVYASVKGEDTVYVAASNVFAAADVAPDGFRRRTLFTVGDESALALDVKRGSGSFMRFVRDGDMWKMIQPRESPASSIKLRRLLSGVMSAAAVDFVWPTGARGEPETATSALLAGFGLDPESAVTVTVKCADGVDRQVSFGNEAKNGLVFALVQNAGAIVTVDAALKDAALAETSDFTDSRLFPFPADSVSRVSIADGETTYLLARRDGGAWQLDSPVAAETDAATVGALIERLLSLSMTDASPTGVTVSIGTNSEPVTVSREAALGGVRPEDLRSRELLHIDPADLRRVVVSDRTGSKVSAIVYDRDRRVWNVEAADAKGTVSASAVEALSAAVNPLVADWIVKLKVSAADLRSYGLDSPRLAVAIDQFKEGSVRRNILIGERAPGGGRFATLGAADAVFVISDEKIASLFSQLVESPGGAAEARRP